MTIPMPRQLRVFDHVEDQYRIWAIVRYLKPEVTEQGTVFVVGVAFIGKRPPDSYQSQPWRRYDIATNTFDSLAAVEESLRPVSTEDQLENTRHQIAVDMQVELLDEKGAVVQTEHTVSENISAHGATLFTTLDLSPGRFIRLRSQQYGITAHAAIRSRNTGADGIARIHVEFIDKEWPL
jgi:hypothetical protein